MKGSITGAYQSLTSPAATKVKLKRSTMYSIALPIGNEWQTISSKMRHDKVKNLHSDSLELAEGFNSPLLQLHSTPLHSRYLKGRNE